MKFKVGDKVRVKNVPIDTSNGDVFFHKDMVPWIGKVVTIVNIIEEKKYRIKEDHQHWGWCDLFFESTTESANPLTKVIEEVVEELNGM